MAEDKAYDFRHDILGQNGLSMASGPLTMKSPLIGSGGDTPDISPLLFGFGVDVLDESSDTLQTIVAQHLNDELRTSFECNKVSVFDRSTGTPFDTATVLDFFSNESNKAIGLIAGKFCIFQGKFGGFSQFENGFECDYFEYVEGVYRCVFNITVTVSPENDGTFTAHFVHQ